MNLIRSVCYTICRIEPIWLFEEYFMGFTAITAKSQLGKIVLILVQYKILKSSSDGLAN